MLLLLFDVQQLVHHREGQCCAMYLSTAAHVKWFVCFSCPRSACIATTRCQCIRATVFFTLGGLPVVLRH
jgi:hypothetical protein